jgi:hypothetical protein
MVSMRRFSHLAFSLVLLLIACRPVYGAPDPILLEAHIQVKRFEENAEKYNDLPAAQREEGKAAFETYRKAITTMMGQAEICQALFDKLHELRRSSPSDVTRPLLAELNAALEILSGQITETKHEKVRFGGMLNTFGGGPKPRPTPPVQERPTPPLQEPPKPPVQVEANTPFTVEIHETGPNPIWSGPWWPDDPRKPPHLYDDDGDDGDEGPLHKYDLWIVPREKADNWEKAHHASPPSEFASYQGHCDGWSVSSILYREPRRAVLASKGTSAPIKFTPGDIKGLLAALWEGYRWQSEQSAGGRGARNLRAVDFHKFLLGYIYAYRLRLVMNLADKAGDVWNYPCDGFTMKGVPLVGIPNTWKVTVQLDVASDKVRADYTGRKPYAYPPVTYWVKGRTPTDWKSDDMSAWWADANKHPWWIFHPIRGSSGPPKAPREIDPERHHFYADANFRNYVEALQRVSSGELESWTAAGLTVTPAPSVNSVLKVDTP